MRLAYTLTPMSPEEAKTFNVPEDQRRQYVRLDRAKINLAPSGGPAKWFKLVGVALGNGTDLYPSGDEVQTVEPWNPPDTWGEMDDALVNRILTEIDAGMPDGTFYSAGPKASIRAAWSVICKFAPHKSEAQAREMIRVSQKARMKRAETSYTLFLLGKMSDTSPHRHTRSNQQAHIDNGCSPA